MSLTDLIRDEEKTWLTGRMESLKLDEGLEFVNGNLEDINILPANTNSSLSISDSGKTYFIPTQTSSNVLTLPDVGNTGARFEFIVRAKPDGSHTLSIGPTGTAKMSGNCVGVGAALAAVASSAKNYLVLSATANNVNVGNYANIVSDGNQYFVYAFSSGTSQGWSLP